MISVNGLNMHVAEKGEGPVVLFLHGFLELRYSWRHQINFMAAHGYRAVADLCGGYEDTTGAPIEDASKFSTLHVVGDLVVLLDAIDAENEKVFIVGHDWGAFIAWHLCLFRPDKVKALVNKSLEFIPWNPKGDYCEQMRGIYVDNHYMYRFQVREAEAWSLKEAIEWVRSWRNTKCIFESDVKLLVDAFQRDRGRSNFDTIVEACSDTLKHFEEVSIVFVNRTANNVAHVLARAACSMSGPMEWVTTAPDFISCNIDLEAI